MNKEEKVQRTQKGKSFLQQPNYKTRKENANKQKTHIVMIEVLGVQTTTKKKEKKQELIIHT